jgi:hypothetical protein
MVYRQKKDHDASQKGRLSHSDHVGRKRTRLLDDNNMLQNASECFKMLQNASNCFEMLQHPLALLPRTRLRN